MKRIIFTHYDLDGGGAAVIMSRVIHEKYNEWPEIKYAGYNTIDNKVLEHRKNNPDDCIYLTDISLKEETCELLDGTNIVIYDHHDNLDHLNKFSWVHINKNYCATRLLYHIFSKKYDISEYANFAKLVDLYDRWLWVENDDKIPLMLNDVWKMNPYKFLDRFKNNPAVLFSAVEQEIWKINEDNRKMELKNIQKDIKTFDIKGYKCACVYINMDVSVISHYILKDNPDIDILFIPLINNSSISVRTKKDIDISLLCQHVGGGGHKQAGGFAYELKPVVENIIMNLFKEYDFPVNNE